MKYKNLTKEQILISIDRLTRFKNTKDKYLRVFADIVLNNLIEPKIKKYDIYNMDYSKLTSISEKILNESVIYILNDKKTDSSDHRINKIIKQYENSLYINDKETQKLLDNNILYIHVANFINENSPVNLKWLKTVIENIDTDITQLREQFALKHPISKIVLVEGVTEEILLPAFSELLGFDFYKKGIQIIPAGGKNQVVKMYYKLIEEIKLPIFILLDKDAEENIKQITPKLRKTDRIHLVSCGEFEDLLPKTLIVKTVNRHFKNFLSITKEHLMQESPTAKILEELFKKQGLHEFKKAEFAKLIRENINSSTDISDEIAKIIKELSA